MVSHGVGFAFFLLATPALLFHAFTEKTVAYLLGTIIFCVSLLMVYTSSTLYHSVYTLKLRQRLRIFDHISIYFLIAGSFTPFILVYVPTSSGKQTLITLWVMVLIGAVFKYFYTHKFKLVSTLAYVGMGAMAFFVIEPLQQNLPEISYLFLRIGLASYVLGVPFYLWKNLNYNHLIWHIFVIGGSLAHFLAIYLM